MDNISEHITYAEATKSQEAIRKGIPNIPSTEELANMKILAEKIFEPIRKHFACPIGISSFFRSKTVNKKIGGSLTSQHCLGQALDLDADIFGKITNKQIFDYVKQNLYFDQLIWEFGTKDNPDWVHISYKPSNSNRNQILRAIRKDNKTVYIPYE